MSSLPGEVLAVPLIHTSLVELFPTLTCGVFVFSSVSAPRPRPPAASPPTLTHSLTHSPHLTSPHLISSHSLTHLISSHSLTHLISLTHPHSLTHSPHLISLTHSLISSHLISSHSLSSHSLTHLISSHSLTHLISLTHSPHLISSHLISSHLISLTHSLTYVHFAWQAWDNVHCQGV